MEKKSLKDKLKKIKATLLSGAVLASATGCAEVGQDEFDEKETKPSIVSEIETEETTSEKTTSTTKEKQKKTTKPKEGTTEETTEEIDDEKTTSEKTTTQVTTEKPIQTTARQEQPTEYHQETTKKTTTKRTTTQTTTEITTEPTTTEIPLELRTYTLEDIKNSDEYVSYIAFGQLCDKFDKDLFRNYIHQTQYGKYIGSQSNAILSILNYNQGINLKMLGGLKFDDQTENDFLTLCDNLNLADYQVFYKTNVDFRKYVLDQNFAELLNRVCAEYKEYVNGNTQPLEEELERYFNSTPNNYVEYYFMANTRAMTKNYSGNYFETLDPEAQKLYYDNVCRPFYNSFIQYSERIHTK